MRLTDPWNTLAAREWFDRRAPLAISTSTRRREAWCALLEEHVPATTRTELAAEARVDRSTLRRWLAVAVDLPELAEVAHLLAPLPTRRLLGAPPPRRPRLAAAVAPWEGYAGRRLLREAAPATAATDPRGAWIALAREALDEAATLDELSALLGVSRRTASRWSRWLRREGVTRATRRRRSA
jgi:hypothetical protein